MPTLLVSPCCFTEWRRGNSTGAHRSTEGRPHKESRENHGLQHLSSWCCSHSCCIRRGVGPHSQASSATSRLRAAVPRRGLHRRPGFGLALAPTGRGNEGARAPKRKWLRKRAVVTPSATAPTTGPWAEERSHRRAKPPPRKASSPTGQTVGDASHTLPGPCVASQPEPTGGAGVKGPLAARYRL